MNNDNSPQGFISGREAALKALVKIEKSDSYANLALPTYKKKVPPEQRGFTTHLVYGTLQRLNTLDWVIGLYSNRPLTSLTPHIRNLLRISVYQLIFMHNIPSPVAVDQAVNLSYRYGHKGVARLVNAILRKIVSEKEVFPWPDLQEDPLTYISLVYSFPEWLVERWINRFGEEETRHLCEAYNHIPPLVIRVNCLRSSRDGLREILEREGVKTELIEDLPEALRVFPEPSISLTELQSYQQGNFTIQGEASIFCAKLLNPKPEEEIIDLCSAPGGKATHLGELMNNKGFIKAGDFNSSRLRLVEKAAQRLGIDIINTHVWDGREIYKFEKEVDGVLCDAPCSGLGVINRKPDLKWAKHIEQIEQLSQLQSQLLYSAARVVKTGGNLLYCVCSNEPEETYGVVDQFLEDFPQFAMAKIPLGLEKCSFGSCREGILEFYPHKHGREGFFMALLKRKK